MANRNHDLEIPAGFPLSHRPGDGGSWKSLPGLREAYRFPQELGMGPLHQVTTGDIFDQLTATR